MMIVSNYPQQTTYWIISVDNTQIFGSTNPDQITEGPNSLVIDYISQDEVEWNAKLIELGLSQVPIDPNDIVIDTTGITDGN